MERKVFSEAVLPSLQEVSIISSNRTRLGGEIIHILTKSQKEAFVKIGTDYERLEIIREYKNLSSLKGYLPVPKIYDYFESNDQAVIALKKVPGDLFHLIISSLRRQRSLLIFKDILNALYIIPEPIKDKLKIATLEEVQDIKFLIDSNKIKREEFMQASKGLSPEQAFDEIQNNLKSHTTQTLSHGDLCLPNIIVTPERSWSLIDWGKGGLGDLGRDLPSLQESLTRNIDKDAFYELCKIMNIKVTSDLQEKMKLYKLIDTFWYNAINLESL